MMLTRPMPTSVSFSVDFSEDVTNVDRRGLPDLNMGGTRDRAMPR